MMAKRGLWIGLLCCLLTPAWAQDPTEDPLETNAVSASHCPGDSVQVYGVWYTQGTYTDTIPSVTSSCDTIVTITITEDSLIPLSVSDSYCAGDSVQLWRMFELLNLQCSRQC